MRALRETDIVRACLDWLEMNRILAWRSNSGAVKAKYKGKTRFVRFNSMPGMSDICAVLPNGRFCAIEVKRPGNTTTQDQDNFLRLVRESGGVALVVYSVDDLAAGLGGHLSVCRLDKLPSRN